MNRIATDEAPMDRDEQAADWCMRLAENRLSPDEQRAFDAWLTHQHNRKALEEAIVVWQGVETAADRPEIIHVRTEALENFRRANSRRWARRVSTRWRWSAGVAAILLLAVGAGLLYVRNSAQVYETVIGERRVTTLADGSQLSLDAATRVEASLADDRRELRLLAGRARFDVAKDPLRPFSVMAANRLVVATGTSFSVELLRRQMRVVLYEGRVEVIERPGSAAETATAHVELTPGNEFVASLEEPAATVIPADTARSLSWETGQLNFLNEPLQSAVERMNRYSKDQLVLGDRTVATYSINGVFTAGDTDAFIEGLKTFFPIEVTRQPGKRVLRSVGPAKK